MKSLFIPFVITLQLDTSISCEEMNKCGEVDISGKTIGKAHTYIQRPTVSHRVQFFLRWADEEIKAGKQFNVHLKEREQTQKRLNDIK